MNRLSMEQGKMVDNGGSVVTRFVLDENYGFPNFYTSNNHLKTDFC